MYTKASFKSAYIARKLDVKQMWPFNKTDKKKKYFHHQAKFYGTPQIWFKWNTDTKVHTTCAFTYTGWNTGKVNVLKHQGGDPLRLVDLSRIRGNEPKVLAVLTQNK